MEAALLSVKRAGLVLTGIDDGLIATVEDEGFDLNSPAGLRAALRQMEGERLVALEQNLRSALDEADDDAES